MVQKFAGHLQHPVHRDPQPETKDLARRQTRGPAAVLNLAQRDIAKGIAKIVSGPQMQLLTVRLTAKASNIQTAALPDRATEDKLTIIMIEPSLQRGSPV